MLGGCLALMFILQFEKFLYAYDSEADMLPKDRVCHFT